MIFPTKADNFSSADGLYQGDIYVGTGPTIKDAGNNITSSNISIGEIVGGVRLSDGLFNVTLGFASSIDVTDPVISSIYVSKSTTSLEEIVDFIATCTDDEFNITRVVIEVLDPSVTTVNKTATKRSGDIYNSTIKINQTGVYTYVSVHCQNLEGLFSETKSIGQTVTVSGSPGSSSTGTSAGSSGGGGGGRGIGDLFIDFFFGSSRRRSQVIESPVGNWSISTKDGNYASYGFIYLDKEDKTDPLQYPVVVNNTGNSILLFDMYCRSVSSSDPVLNDSCTLVKIIDGNFTLLPGKQQIIGVTLNTPENITNGNIYLFEIIARDNGDFEQSVSYTVGVSYFIGTIKKNAIAFIFALLFAIIVLAYVTEKEYSALMKLFVTMSVFLIVFLSIRLLQYRVFGL